jgi:hypothetical protein
MSILCRRRSHITSSPIFPSRQSHSHFSLCVRQELHTPLASMNVRMSDCSKRSVATLVQRLPVPVATLVVLRIVNWLIRIECQLRLLGSRIVTVWSIARIPVSRIVSMDSTKPTTGTRPIGSKQPTREETEEERQLTSRINRGI